MEVARMFNRIAKRYDFINRVLSFGMDQGWRRKVVRMIAEQRVSEVLDLATGTGDLAIALCEAIPGARIIGLDPSEEMLAIAHEKLRVRGLGNRVMLVPGVGEQMPFGDGEFDAITCGFGIRNASDMDQAMREMLRVLKPTGRALILEFSLPTNRFIRPFHLFYLRHILPRIGAALSRDKTAYTYLNRTIEAFPSGDAFLTRLKNAGFTSVSQRPLLFGAVSIYSGVRSPA